MLLSDMLDLISDLCSGCGISSLLVQVSALSSGWPISHSSTLKVVLQLLVNLSPRTLEAKCDFSVKEKQIAVGFGSNLTRKKPQTTNILIK